MNLTASLVLTVLTISPAQSELSKSLTFHAGFDGDYRAGFAKGDPMFYTSPTLKRATREEGNHREDTSLIPDGRFGQAIRFGDKATKVVFYDAKDNFAFQKKNWSGTISFWLRLDPEKDLKPGYADPIQITDRSWNNNSFFVDFTKDDTPRVFRFAVFSDYGFWNPDNIKWDLLPAEKRPMVSVKNPPFSREQWTHIVMSFSGFNTGKEDGITQCYLNGKLQGSLEGPEQFSWNSGKAAILLGLSYIGDMDDFALFDRNLSASEVLQLYQLNSGAKELYVH